MRWRPGRRLRSWLLAGLLTAAVAGLLTARSHLASGPAEHSPGYHLDPTDLAALELGELGPGVRILCYHYFRRDLDPGYLARVLAAVILGMPTLGPQEFWTTPAGQFERHLRYFRDAGIPVLTLDDIAAHHRRGETLPDPAVVLTIDDADRSVHELAWPLLQKYGVRAHLFVPTGRVDTRWSGIQVCSWADLREMAASGAVILGSHTHDLHFKVMTDRGRQPVFWNPDRLEPARLDDLRRRLAALPGDAIDSRATGDPIGADLLLSRRLIQRHGGQPCRWLAWPYGFGHGDLDSLAATLGFEGTLSLKPVTVTAASPTWHLGRFTLTAKTTPRDLADLFASTEP